MPKVPPGQVSQFPNSRRPVVRQRDPEPPKPTHGIIGAAGAPASRRPANTTPCSTYTACCQVCRLDRINAREDAACRERPTFRSSRGARCRLCDWRSRFLYRRSAAY